MLRNILQCMGPSLPQSRVPTSKAEKSCSKPMFGTFPCSQVHLFLYSLIFNIVELLLCCCYLSTSHENKTVQDLFFANTTYDGTKFLRVGCHNWVNLVWRLWTWPVGLSYQLGELGELLSPGTSVFQL